MKTETYKFKVDVIVNDGYTDDAVMDIIHEVDDQQFQMNITHTINKKTSEVHKDILLDMMYDFNEKVKSLGVEFQWYETANGNNCYLPPQIRLHRLLTDREKRNGIMYKSMLGIVVKLCGESDINFSKSKYTTYTGAYHLKYRDVSLYNVENRIIDTLDELLTEEKDLFKETYTKFIKDVQ
tara:strand:+ start:488 stop:1030 length:543 start_codon:yes stop_codon:yes gene_type:complete